MNSFMTDKQTLEDLNLLGKFKPQSIFSLFNQVRTSGGERLLEKMFRNPLTDHRDINRRSDVFRYFQRKGIRFSLSSSLFREAESYLTASAGGAFPMIMLDMIRKKIAGMTVRDEQFDRLLTGITAAATMLHELSRLLDQLTDHPQPEELEPVRKIFADKRLQWLKHWHSGHRLSFMEVVRYHYLLRRVFGATMERALDLAYHIDVYIAVSNVADTRQLSYAVAFPKEDGVFYASTLRHPGLSNGVPNTVSFGYDKNLLFLTGANMAGKSTLMKAFGIAVYLAHMGFPVAAGAMKFSVFDGLFTSINVPDDISVGYSHFYAEVLRVKQVAQEVGKGYNLVVIFDELFKGTNVKDAYDATLSVTRALAAYRNCFFIISTHIVEVGEALQQTGDNIVFKYMPTLMTGNVPRYTYLLANGISSDRQGMSIIENEGIFELLGTGKS